MTRTLVIAAVVLMGVTVTGVGSVQAQEEIGRASCRERV